MSPLVVVLLALVGLFAGSAVWNVSRNQAGKRPLFEPALCDSGAGVLPVTTWLPFFGFGTARACPADGTPQSPKRLLFELAVAGYAAVAAWRIDDALGLVAVLAFSIPLLIIFLVDSWTRLIYTNVIALGIVLGLVFAAADDWKALLSAAAAMVVGALVFAGFYVLAIVIYRNPKVVPFGLGDVYLAAMIGSMVRLDDLMRALIYGIFLAGGSVGVMLLLKRVNRKQAVPYGPYLVIGAMIALVL